MAKTDVTLRNSIKFRIHLIKVIGSIIFLCLVIFSFSFFSGGTEMKEETLKSGNSTLTVNSSDISVSYSISYDSIMDFQYTNPLDLNLLDSSEVSVWLTGDYTSIRRSDSTLICTREIWSISGTVFRIIDSYSKTNNENSFVLSRDITIVTVKNDKGILSRFSLISQSDLKDNNYFIQGICYTDNSHARPGALATNFSDDYL